MKKRKKIADAHKVVVSRRLGVPVIYDAKLFVNREALLDKLAKKAMGSKYLRAKMVRGAIEVQLVERPA